MEGLDDAQANPVPNQLPPSQSPPIDDHPPSADISTPTPPPSNELEDEELRSKILRQVEFYFSDANLPTDDFLLKIIRRPGNTEGWVPIKTLASFHKMKKLTKNILTIVAALRTSTELEVSPEGQRVCRLTPLPDVNLDDIRSKTVITWNLPEKPTIEHVMDLFSTVGTVEMARIRKTDHPEPLLTRGLKTEVGKSARDCYALIEYKTREEAIKAVEKLHDESNWRSGLRVKLLIPLPPPEKSSGGVGGVAAGAGGERKKKTLTQGSETATAQILEDGTSMVQQERPKPAWARGKQNLKPQPTVVSSATVGETATSATTSDAVAADAVTSSSDTFLNTRTIEQKEQQPRMPDGSRGFGIGRGSVIPSSLASLFNSISLSTNSNMNGDSSTSASAPGSLVES